MSKVTEISCNCICYAQISKTLIQRGKNDHDALWHERKGPQREMSFKLTVYKFSNLLINNTPNVDLMKNNGEAHFFLQELLE